MIDFFKKNKVLLFWVALLHLILGLSFYIMTRLANDVHLTDEYVPTEEPPVSNKSEL